MTTSPELASETASETISEAASAALAASTAAPVVRAVGRAGAELAEPGSLRELGVELAVPVVATLPGTGNLYRRLADGRWWLVEPLAEATVLGPVEVARLQPCGPPGPHLAV